MGSSIAVMNRENAATITSTGGVSNWSSPSGIDAADWMVPFARGTALGPNNLDMLNCAAESTAASRKRRYTVVPDRKAR